MTRKVITPFYVGLGEVHIEDELLMYKIQRQTNHCAGFLFWVSLVYKE